MANSPSIVLASLSDDQLKKSIDSLVSHVDEAMKKMVQSTNNAVGEMEAKLKSLGSLKIDSGGTNDGGTGRRTQQHEKLTKAVNDASEAFSKETQKLQDLQQSLSGASDREQNFISQKERAANTIAQENELLGKQQSELAALKAQEQQLADAHQRDVQARQQNAAAIEKQRGQVKFYEEELNSLQSKLASAQAKEDRYYSLLAKSREAISKSFANYTNDKYGFGYDEYEHGKSVFYKTERDVRSLIDALSKLKETNVRHGFLDEIKRPYAEMMQPSRDSAEVFKRFQEDLSIQIKALQGMKKGLRGDARKDIDDRIAAAKELLEVYKLLSNTQNTLNKTFSKENLLGASDVGGIKKDIKETAQAYEDAKQKLGQLTQATQQSSQASQQKAQIDTQIAAKEKEIAETKGRIAAATKEQSEADKNASQAAKEKANIQSQVASQEKYVAEAKKQLTTATQQHTDAETKSSRATKEKTLTLDQQASAINTAIQSEKKYTEEIRKQISAIAGKKDATKAFEQISLMPSNTMDEIKAKGQALVELVKKVKDTPLMSQSNVKLAEKMIGSLANQYRALKEEKEKVANTQTINAAAENTTRRSLEQEKQDLERLKALQEERRQQIIQTGIAAQQQARILRESIGQQMQSADYTKQVDKVKELQNALTEMKNAYKQPIDSSIKKALEEDIAKTEKALDIAKRYNMTVAGLGAVGVGGKAPTDTLAAYSAEAQRLAGIYKNLSTEERSASAGQGLKRKYQELGRAASQVRKELERPINLKDALGGSEKTLDDIAYKMQRLASYRSGLDANAQHNEIRRVNYEYDVLKKKMDEVMQKNSQMISSNTALGRSWNYMKNRLAFYFTIGASTQFVKNLIEVRSQYEMNERALGILVDSAERGTQIFRELSDMALVSPYTLIELSSAAKQLTAYDVAAKDVVDTTRRLADMASAVGVPVERLTYALGQIKAYGYLNSRDARMFANAGIPLVKELADHYTRLEGRLVSTADIYDRIKKKAIDYNDVMQVMNEMTDEGGKFYDFQAKMADTLKVQLANLTLAWNNMLNDLGNSQQGLLTSGIGALKELFLHWKDLDRILTNLAVTIGTAKAAQLLLNISFGKGTLAAIKNISAIEGNTAAMYENALSKSNLSKAEARWLISTNKSNVALRAAMVNMKLLTAEEANAAASTTVLGMRMGWLGRVMKTNFFGLASVVRGAAVGMKMLGKAMLSIVTNPVFLSITAAMSLVDALLYYNQIAEKTAEMNKAIADNAKEASEAIGDYLKDSVNIGNRAKAVQGVLSVSEGQKAWESIREQIELSSDAASVFVSKLLEEEDINKRVKDGFDVAESIREATNAMAGLNSEALKVSQDSWLWGAFGEGLAEDLEDYIEAVQRGRKNGANIGSRYFAAGERKEAKDELTAFANDAEEIIRDRLGAGVNDAVQLKEAIERIKKEVIAANPQIKGEVKKWFDVEVDRMMAERFGGVYNELSSIQSQFIEHIKHDSGAALRRLSDDILDTSKELDDDVLGAISKAWDKLKDELPAESQDLISKLQKQMDENPLTLRVLLLQAGEQQIRDAIQKDYEQHFYDSNIGEKPTRPKDIGSLWGDYKGDYKAFAAAQEKHEKEMVEYNQKNAEWEAKRAEYVAKYGDFNKKNDETRAKWAKRVNDEIKAADAEEKAAKHARESLEAELSLEERKTDARYLSAVQEEQAAKDRKSAAQEAWNYEKLYQEEKNKGNRGSKKDPLLDALKQEISLVEKLQSDYDKLSKSGASQTDALETIRGAYGKTIRLLNAQLGKYGLPQLDISQLITGKDPNKTLAHFKQTLDTLVSKGMLTLERSKELEAVVEKFTLSAKTYNLDMITKGLNNELGKLKDEYELAVELDANPELGDMFADMFGINTSTLPKTFGDALDRAQIIINRKLAEMNITTPFDLMESNIDSFAKSTGLDRESAVIKELVSVQNTWRDMFKKNITETEKVLDDYIKKYGDYSDKIAEIEANRLEKLKKLNEAYYTEEMRKRPEYVAKLNAIEQGASKEKQQVDFDEFKNSRYYTMMFENLDYISTKTIRDMRDRVRELMDTMNDLTPEQLKTLISQYEKLEQKLVKRSPFKTLTKDLKEYFATSKERNVANQEFKNAQKEYDAQKKNVAALKEKYEQAKANSKTSKSRLDFLQIEIDGENDILKILKQQLDAAQKKADKYNLTAKLAKSEALAVAQVVSSNLQSLVELRDFLQQDLGVELSDKLNGLVDGLSKVGQGINKITSSATSGDVVGVITGVGQTIYGLYDGIASIFGGGSAGDRKIVRQIEESEKAVKRLELAYKNLEVAIENAYGANVIGAKQAAIANKELQLAELRRQLALEKSRDSKDRDDDRIIELQGQIIDLQNDIKRSAQEIATSLLGISSVADAAQGFMDSYIDALRSGEDAMEGFNESVNDMIANLISKIWVTRVIGPQLERIIDEWNNSLTERSKKEADAYEKAKDKETKLSTMNGKEILSEMTGIDIDLLTWDMVEKNKDLIEKYVSSAHADVDKAKKELDKASTPTKDDVGTLVDALRAISPELADQTQELLDWLTEFKLMKGDASNNLSALQQGISQISETTANALESYMNGVSQQVYYHSSLLEQIRDSVVGLDLDVSLGVQSQMLLQLQNSYQTQQAIQQILEGVLVPSGRAFAVELLS